MFRCEYRFGKAQSLRMCEICVARMNYEMHEEFNETHILLGKLVGLKSLPQNITSNIIIKRNVECEIINSCIGSGKVSLLSDSSIQFLVCWHC